MGAPSTIAALAQPKPRELVTILNPDPARARMDAALEANKRATSVGEATRVSPLSKPKAPAAAVQAASKLTPEQIAKQAQGMQAEGGAR
jgi:hypothetical protein